MTVQDMVNFNILHLQDIIHFVQKILTLTDRKYGIRNNRQTIETSFSATQWTGNGGTQDVAVGFDPDFVWIKSYGGSEHHLVNRVSGFGTRLLKYSKLIYKWY